MDYIKEEIVDHGANKPDLDEYQMTQARYKTYIDMISTTEDEDVPIFAADAHDVDMLANAYAILETKKDELTAENEAADDDEKKVDKLGLLPRYLYEQLG